MSDKGPEAPADEPLLGDWMPRSELAAQLGVSKDTLQRWHSQRVGPPLVRVGNRVLYRRAAVREWLIAREVQPVARRGAR